MHLAPSFTNQRAVSANADERIRVRIAHPTPAYCEVCSFDANRLSLPLTHYLSGIPCDTNVETSMPRTALALTPRPSACEQVGARLLRHAWPEANLGAAGGHASRVNQKSRLPLPHGYFAQPHDSLPPFSSCFDTRSIDACNGNFFKAFDQLDQDYTIN